MEDIRHFIDDFIDKTMRKDDRYRAVCQLEDDIYDAIKFLDSKEQDIRNSTGDWNPALFTCMANIAFTLKGNVVHEAMLSQEANALWTIVEAKGALGFILVNENKDWFKKAKKARAARLVKNWRNGMSQLGETLKPYETENKNVEALVDAISRVDHALT
jgi:hypothetical protein